MTDALCVLGLDNSIIAVKQKFGLAKNEAVRSHLAIDGIVAHVVNVGIDNIGARYVASCGERLYTAGTCGRELVLLIGSADTLEQAVRRRSVRMAGCAVPGRQFRE